MGPLSRQGWRRGGAGRDGVCPCVRGCRCLHAAPRSGRSLAPASRAKNAALVGAASPQEGPGFIKEGKPVPFLPALQIGVLLRL